MLPRNTLFETSITSISSQFPLVHGRHFKLFAKSCSVTHGCGSNVYMLWIKPVYWEHFRIRHNKTDLLPSHRVQFLGGWVKSYSCFFLGFVGNVVKNLPTELRKKDVKFH